MSRPVASHVSHVLGAVAMLCSLTALQVSAGNEIHRCSDGRNVTYTDRGCGAHTEAVVFNVASVSTARDFQPAIDREVPVTLGMSPRSVFDALGRPVETIATLQGRQLVEYWLYRGAASGVTRVAFQEGRVTGIHAR